MIFNPFRDRKSNQMYDETDWIGGTILLAALLLLSGLLVNKVMTKESELKYLKQNNCKVKEYDVKNTNNSKMSLWVCNNGTNYVSK